MKPNTDNRLFHRDFTLVVIGQIISLFGNAVLRFALPLYIYDQSGSAALFGAVSAVSFLPMIVMSPVGGIIADRVNKQRIMVALDFFTCALTAAFLLFSGSVSMVPLVVVVLMLLYGINGAYAPAVQASLPVLCVPSRLEQGNAVVNLVNSFSALIGPVIGGVLYAAYGLGPVMLISCVCFFLSAVMELFIRIPHRRQESKGSVWATVRSDLSVSGRFILREKPVIAKVVVVVCLFNLFMSSMLIIGLPVIIKGNLGLGSEMYGLAEGALALGALTGGVLSGVVGSRLQVNRTHLLLLFCGICIAPMAVSLLLGAPAMASFLVIAAVGFCSMAAATMFSVKMLAFVQAQTPVEIVGKVISMLMALSLVAQPIGQALYGVLFEQFAGSVWVVLLGASVVSCLIALLSRAVFRQLGDLGPAAGDTAPESPQEC